MAIRRDLSEKTSTRAQTRAPKLATLFCLCVGALGLVACKSPASKAKDSAVKGAQAKEAEAAKAKAKAPEAAPKAEDGAQADADKARAQAEVKAKDLPPLPTDVMAVVGKVSLPMKPFSEVYELKKAKYVQRKREMPKTAARRYRKTLAERLIYQEILRQEAEKQGVKYDAKELEQRMEQQKQGISDWPQHLARRGESESSLREMYIKELREKALLKKDKKLEVTPKEVKAEYDRIKENYRSKSKRVRASHILISTRPSGDDPNSTSESAKKARRTAAKKRAQELYALAKKRKADFAALAKEHSDGPSKYKGGDLGVFSAERMVKEFSDAAFKLKVGQVSKPVETKFGFHIIKVTEKYKPGLLPLAALREQIETRMRGRKLLDGRRELRRHLAESYKVDDRVLASLGDVGENDHHPAGHGLPHGSVGGHGHGHGHGH